jgi:hypothetical protein
MRKVKGRYRFTLGKGVIRVALMTWEVLVAAQAEPGRTWLGLEISAKLRGRDAEIRGCAFEDLRCTTRQI